MKIAGIDYSIASPSICIFEGDVFSFDKCKIFFLNDKKKNHCSFLGNQIFGNKITKTENKIENYDKNSEFIISKIFQIDEICIEDYSYGSIGKSYNIAENCGILKYKFQQKNIKYRTVPPTTIKKFATGKGNADKELLLKTFEDETKIDLKQILGETEKSHNPSSDIIDSYFIVKYLYFCLTNKK